MVCLNRFCVYYEDDTCILDRISIQLRDMRTSAVCIKKATALPWHKYGSYRARTCDPLLVRQMLSQLS